VLLELIPAYDLGLVERVALVTGASRGIGLAIASRLANAGAYVAVGSRKNHPVAEAFCRRLQSAGHKAIPVVGDLIDPQALNRVVDETETKLGPIDILVSNAGSSHQHNLAELTLQTWDTTMHEHLRAAFLLTQRVIPGMCARHWGRIVFISSVAAFNGGLVGPHYAAAKAGLIGLMHSLATSFSSNGVTVNAVAPALIETDMLKELGVAARRDLSQKVPVGRYGKSEEVADLVLAVLRNPYVTGQTLLVDGGIYPR